MPIQSKENSKANVLLAVSGCIAAYKACEVLRGLQKADCDVRVLMTAAGTDFVGPTTFEALSGHPVALDFASFPESAIPHIDLSAWADVVLVCPATANVVAKMAHGIADDVLTSTVIAAPGKLLVAPAMNVRMWSNPITQENIQSLAGHGVEFVTPVAGYLACGDIGEGKLADVDVIVDATLDYVRRAKGTADLAGKHVVITAGPTHEAIDPVRFIANASSGKMGYALARTARAHGARVTLVSGPTALDCPVGVNRVDVESAQDMYEATTAAFADADIAICAAAVADYRPANPADHKLKKSTEPLDKVELVETTDILKSLCADKGARFVAGFAAETNDVVSNARSKLERKGADMIVANDVSREESTFGSDTNAITIVSAAGDEELPLMSKDDCAEAIVSRIAALIAS